MSLDSIDDFKQRAAEERNKLLDELRRGWNPCDSDASLYSSSLTISSKPGKISYINSFKIDDKRLDSRCLLVIYAGLGGDVLDPLGDNVLADGLVGLVLNDSQAIHVLSEDRGKIH